MDETLQRTLGDAARAARRRLGLTQEEAARKVGLAQSVGRRKGNGSTAPETRAS